MSGWVQRLAYLQYVYPKRLLSWLMMRWTRVRIPAVRRFQIKSFIWAFNVDLSDALEPDLEAYLEFNTFFTRPLRPGARPIAARQRTVVSPADGVIAARGFIEQDTALQAKGQPYRVSELLGDPSQTQFNGGHYITVYLSPRDYHRVHACAAGRLTAIRYIPGALFSVSLSTTRYIPRLFARNERAVLSFETDFGPLALVLVGAVCVGSIETVWTGAFPSGQAASIPYPSSTFVAKGQEVGRFNMGSTAIALLPPGGSLTPGGDGPVRMGEVIATW